MESRKGQVGIIILLIVVVMSTIGISVVSRSSTDVSISQSSEDANRVLDAAESGVEKALSDTHALDPSIPGQVTGSINSINNIAVNYTVDRLFTTDTVLDEGSSVGIDLTGAINGDALNIYWSKEQNCTQNPASLIITIYNKVGSAVTYRKSYLAACAQNHSGDGFTSITANGGATGFLRFDQLALQTGDVFARIRSIYNQTELSITGAGWTLPVQQFRIVSIAQGTVGTQTKEVQVDRGLPTAPAVFDYALYSGTGISN
ncbi:hypothetical protein C5B42_04885 [Candidatus Cerribacteria bacterium 'Amazon FNV 2010 28 9']|uniref:Type 4 fimbrial biogenesis protein PilX N-terminal domain-containing protein n=1 Tax=Candidatus Cerribacteria bacterium 'Amazon FNV 2010 28 9' TaxID=2081795 RepID=A0A317JN87_9BACT|nr:MAG: hypothetical protein C5B42_04885 [Candidatus Cerribacteria bacterium 'Amazon FNV 2010 28 9']